MAQALPSSFDEWIQSLLNDLQSNDVDMSDFVQYLMGVIASDSETDEEKQIAIVELLSDLDLKHNHDIDNLSQQILARWNSSQEYLHSNPNIIDKSRLVENQDDHDAINTALINAMNQIESTAKQQKQSNNKSDDDSALRKHKSQIIAKYAEISDGEFDDEDETAGENTGYSENSLFRNTNTKDIEDQEKKIREIQHEAYTKQQEKNKIDINNQKQKDDERKKKAQQRSQKQERRR